MARKKRLRKTLPKDLGALMDAAVESGDSAAVHAALEGCELDARGGYAKGTPLMMRECSPQLAKWVVERGTDVNAGDTYGNTALHRSAGAPFNYRLSPADLIELGADVTQQTSSGLTPLHSAADSANVAAVEVLLSHGVDVNATDGNGLTPLEYALLRVSNVALVRMVPTVAALLEAGAKKSDKARQLTTVASERFEFHRAGFNADLVEETAAAAQALCSLMSAEPAPRRKMHDGTSPIEVPPGRWQDQHAELWDLLVPSSGPCATLQGEVVRIAGRIGGELSRNGGGNWDADYRAMATAFCEHIASHNAVPAPAVAECRQTVKRLLQDHDGSRLLAELAVEWVKLNPKPVPLAAPSYSR